MSQKKSNHRRLTPQQVIFYALCLLVVASMLLTAFAR